MLGDSLECVIPEAIDRDRRTKIAAAYETAVLRACNKTPSCYPSGGCLYADS